MKLEAGKTYLNRKGERVMVTSWWEHDSFYCFIDQNKVTYTANGEHLGGTPNSNDLIAEAPEEGVPVTLADLAAAHIQLPAAKRKIVQIASATYPECHALCDDGTVWRYGDIDGVSDFDWVRLPAIPQP